MISDRMFEYNNNFNKSLPVCLGLPTIEGKTALGASSPANPAYKKIN